MISPVRLSVCHTGGSGKTVEGRILKFTPYGNPIAVVFAGKFHLEILMGSPCGDVKQGSDGENKPFSRFKRQYLENNRRYAKVTICD